MATDRASASNIHAFASVAIAGYVGHRTVWQWSIAAGTERETGTDLQTATGDATDALRTLAGFLSAHAESREGSENADLFAVSRETSEAVSEAIYSEIGWDD